MSGEGVGENSLSGVDVSRDLGSARVYYTRLDCDTAEQAKESTAVLNKAAGFLRSELSRDATMRSVPRLTFYFDTSVGQGRHLESLISQAKQADQELGLRGDDPEGEA